MESNITLTKKVNCIYREKGSKFLGFLIPINNERKFKKHLLEFSKKYHDASHICFAYRYLSSDRKSIIEKKSDGGEPSGTAGQPILFLLQKRGIINVALFVIRYFGGTKLGKGGLTRTYRICASLVIEQGEWIPYIPMMTLILESQREFIGQVENQIYKMGGKIISREFILEREKCICEIEIPVKLYKKIRRDLNNQFSGTLLIRSIDSN